MRDESVVRRTSLGDVAVVGGGPVARMMAKLPVGSDLPDDFIDAWLTPRRVWSLLKMATNDRARLKRMIALKDSLSRSSRQWHRWQLP